MNTKSYEFFTSNETARNAFNLVVSFVTAWVTDRALFDDVEAFTVKHNKENRDKHFSAANPSGALFCQYRQSKELESLFPMHIVNGAFSLLEEKLLLIRSVNPQPGNPGTQTYSINAGFIEYLVEKDVLYNHLLGFRHIVHNYKNSVVKIVVKSDGGDESIGTGWCVDVIASTDSSKSIRVVVTNDHVIDGCKSFTILTKDDQIVPHHSVERFQQTDKIDMALIEIEGNKQVPSFSLGPVIGVLEEVITIGYPSIPLSLEAYQVVHKGEVNSYVKDYSGQDLLIISARTSPGHSGSPVLDAMGLVVGMVARELFEKSAFVDKGVTPYFACIPASTIHRMLMKSKLLSVLD
jgi:hypothetical protein